MSFTGDLPHVNKQQMWKQGAHTVANDSLLSTGQMMWLFLSTPISNYFGVEELHWVQHPSKTL